MIRFVLKDLKGWFWFLVSLLVIFGAAAIYAVVVPFLLILTFGLELNFINWLFCFIGIEIVYLHVRRYWI